MFWLIFVFTRFWLCVALTASFLTHTILFFSYLKISLHFYLFYRSSELKLLTYSYNKIQLIEETFISVLTRAYGRHEHELKICCMNCTARYVTPLTVFLLISILLYYSILHVTWLTLSFFTLIVATIYMTIKI